MDPFFEELPEHITARVEAVRSPDEDILAQVATDMVSPRRFGRGGVVLTTRRVMVLSGEDPSEFAEAYLKNITRARAESLVGGGRLDIEHRGGDLVRAHYSSTMIPKFAALAEGIDQLIRGEPLDLPAELEPSRCPRCGRLLPERGGACPACARRGATLRRLLRYLEPYRLRVLALLGLTMAGAGVSLAPPYLVKHIIDDVLTPGMRDAQEGGVALLALLVGALLCVNVLTWGAEILRRWLNGWVGFRVVEALRLTLFQALQMLPLRFYDRRKVGSLISRMTNDSDLVEEFLLFGLPFLISNSLMVLGILGLLFYMNPTLAGLVLIPVPPIMIGSILIWGRLQGYWRRWSAGWSRLSSHLNESITGIRVIKAFAQEPREGQRFETRNRALQEITVRAERSWLVFFMVTNFFMNFGGFFVWYFGGRQLLHGRLALGELMAFNFYLMMLYRPLKWFGDFYGFIVRALAGAERIFTVIDGPAEPFSDAQARPAPRLAGHVRFRNVSFEYEPGNPVLRDVDLDVQPGEMIGLVGRSGVGKSTLIQLVCRFYDATRGVLEIDGMDIRRIRLQDLRSQIGLVAQESFLFNATIAENIRYGRPEAGLDEVMRAARAANAHEFIIRKPDGYDMMVGEGGSKLSGGEKQRIAIARALLHDPKILILDEATSSLDTPTERRIQEAIRRLVQGRTTFAIAHRLSTLRSADRLVVLDEGRIAETGTHEELMARRGIFYHLVKTQQVSTAVMTTGTTARDTGSREAARTASAETG